LLSDKITQHPFLFILDKKAQLSLTNPRDANRCQQAFLAAIAIFSIVIVAP